MLKVQESNCGARLKILNLGEKLYGLFAVIIGGMWFYIKWITSKNARLEQKAKVNDKLKEIRERHKEDKEEVLKDEAKRVEKVKAEIKEIKYNPDDVDHNDLINRLRDNNTRT